MPPRFIARQLSRPMGPVGRFVAAMMNLRNAPMNTFAARLLDAGPSDRVLEIGFGGGALLGELLKSARLVAGVDLSPDVVARGRARFAGAVAAGRADLRQGNVDALPFEPASFDRVCSINTVYFWPSLDAGCAEILRVLAPGGRAVLGFYPKSYIERNGFPTDIFNGRTPDEIVEALGRAGFRDVRIERPKPGSPWMMAVAARL